MGTRAADPPGEAACEPESLESPRPSRPSLASLRARYLAPLAASLLALRSLALATWLLFLVPFAMDISYPEGAIAARAWDVACGRTAYSDWRDWPHAMAPYGPLTYYPAGWIGRLAFEDPHPRDLYRVGRVQSLLAIAALAALVFGIVRRDGFSPAWGFVGVAAFMGWEKVLSFTVSYRPDAPQAALALLAVWIAVGGSARGGRIVAAFAALSAAMWFKTTSWGPFLALVAWVWTTAGPRRALAAAAAFGGANLALALATNALMDGRLFLNMVGSLDNGWEPNNVQFFYRDVSAIPGAILIVGGAASAGRIALARRSGAAPSPLDVAVVGSFLAATAQNMKVGADINYYLEPYAFASVSTAILVARAWRGDLPGSARLREALLWGVLALAFADAYLNLRTARDDLAGIRLSWRETLTQKRVRAIEGPILVTSPFLALERPAPPTILDWVHFRILLDRGLLSDAELIAKIERREFAAVVLPNRPEHLAELPWFSPRFREAFLANYGEGEAITNMIFFRPRSDAPAARGG